MTINVKQEDLAALEAVYYKFNSLRERLTHMSVETQKELEEIERACKNLFTEYWNEENETQDKKIEYFEQISKDHKIKNSTWSIFEIDDINQAVGTVQKIVYGNVEIVLDKENATWLDLWKAADDLIVKSKTHHYFIEGFEAKGFGVYELVTGS